MSLRTLLLIALILLVAGFVALNLESILQPTQLHFGVADIQAPLGLVMLGITVALFVIFLLSLVYFQTMHLMEVRRITKEANEQRALADKAEASRFTELREFLATEMKAATAREAAQTQALVQHIDALQTRLSTGLEQTGNSIHASLGEIEDRLESMPSAAASRAPGQQP